MQGKPRRQRRDWAGHGMVPEKRVFKSESGAG